MSIDKSEEISKASLKLFSERGYLKTSMSDVASAIGLTKGGLYHHVEKKEHLLFLIHNEMADAFLNQFEETYKSAKDPVDKLSDWVEAHLKLMANYGPNVKIFFTELKHLEKAPGFDMIIKKRDRIFFMLHDIITEGVKLKIFREDQDPFLTAMLVNGMINWFFYWYRNDGRLSLDKIVNMVQSFVLNGVKK